MSRKREQRLRRKAAANLRKVESERDAALKLKRIALRAIRYVGEIDAPNPHEPWAIANRRDELRDEVHALQGKPQRGVRRDQQSLRANPSPNSGEGRAASIVPLRPATPVPVMQRTKRAPRVVPIDAKLPDSAGREQLVRELEVKRAELRNAAKRLGAEANKRRHDNQRVAELEVALDAAAKAYSLAESQLGLFAMRERRAAEGAAS